MNKPSWEKDLREMVYSYNRSGIGLISTGLLAQLEDFIETLLSQERKRWEEEVKKFVISESGKSGRKEIIEYFNAGRKIWDKRLRERLRKKK